MLKNETGRSMVEMLGVLAIIGVLSVGGIAGYTMAMNKYKANEVLNSISMLSTIAHAQNAGEGLTSSAATLSSGEAGITVGVVDSATITIAGTSTAGNGYAVTVTGAGTDVCKNITTASPSGPTDATAVRIGWYLTSCT